MRLKVCRSIHASRSARAASAAYGQNTMHVRYIQRRGGGGMELDFPFDVSSLFYPALLENLKKMLEIIAMGTPTLVSQRVNSLDKEAATTVNIPQQYASVELRPLYSSLS